MALFDRKKQLVNLLKKIPYDKPYKIVFSDQSIYQNIEGAPCFVIQFNDDQVISDFMIKGSLAFGEGYMNQQIDLEGNIQEVCELGFSLIDNHINPAFIEKMKILLGYLATRNTLEGSRKNIQTHYDVGNEFYQLWLDEKMQYTCAYFPSEDADLETAQANKLDIICRKLNLQPGELVVEAGCGWGGFARFAAENYGVRVKAFNISPAQVSYAREKAKEMQLGDRVEYILDDYRTIPKHVEACDKFVSIGMFEHVGSENYSQFYDIIARVLSRDGLALVHSIGKIRPAPTDAWLARYIFPGSYMPSLREMISPIENENHGNLHVIDVENMRYHYALTLDHWIQRFEKNVDKIRSKYSERFVRMFRFYLNASAAGFRYGGITLFQVLLNNQLDFNLHDRSRFYTGKYNQPHRAVKKVNK